MCLRPSVGVAMFEYLVFLCKICLHKHHIVHDFFHTQSETTFPLKCLIFSGSHC